MTQINFSNLKLLSHSAIQILRQCPRKFELDRLSKDFKTPEESTVHTAFGSAMGSGIQKLLETGDLKKAKLEAFINWDIPLYEEMPKANKSFAHACLAIEKFYAQVLPSLGDWQLAFLKNGKPAVELSFAVTLPQGYFYRGYLDGVLFNPIKKKYRVLELKSTGSTSLTEAQYGKSFQGVGYSVVLDKIAESAYSDYEVLYIVYKTKSEEFEELPFLKLAKHRMNWLSDLLLTVEQIELFKRAKRFPQNGDACSMFGRACRFYEECDYLNSSIFAGAQIIHESLFDPTKFDFVFTFEDLLSNQISSQS